jgi:hypothetical protein
MDKVKRWQNSGGFMVTSNIGGDVGDWVGFKDYKLETDRLKSLLSESEKRMVHSTSCAKVNSWNCPNWESEYGCYGCGKYKDLDCPCTCGLDDLKKRIAEVVG